MAQNGSVAIGGIYYSINPKYRGRAIEVTFDPERVLFRGHLAGLPEVVDIIPRGLTKESLMGEAGTIRGTASVSTGAAHHARGAARDGLHSIGAAYDFV